ncbi:MAG TPA: aldehyde dehydrogenase family protein [Planctomycetaceae bacterium]|jgi:acyl-CoA reductase-like NAD-dependent aldehyde dehydrogenase|nr:aldehyde dehydrogenase family protein [Planctomycetaceae bacterium]
MVKIVSPVDGSVVAERPCATPAELDAALSNAQRAQTKWSTTPIAERARLCSAAVEALLSMAEEIAPELAWQMGRPVQYGRNEVLRTAERARHMIEIAPAALADHVPAPLDGFRRFIRREPLGTLFVIAPWNYPYLSAVNSVIPGLMAGNTVVLKHAAQTLLAGERFQAAFDRAGLPSGLFRNLVLDHDQTAKIIRSRRVHQVNFTGSVAAGREIETAAAGTFIGTGLELGGKDPAYIRGDANLPFAIESVADGAFFNSGQSCCAVERVYVHKQHFDRVVAGFVDFACKYVFGNPLDPKTTLGPMVRAGAADFVRGQIREAVGQGARRMIPEHIFPADKPGSAYLAPEVLINVNHDMAIMRDETFGPVVGVMPVESDEEAIRLMNDSPYGLSASIWTQDADAAERIGEQIETGTVFMNRCDYLDPALAWTGVKDTGRGITLSALGYSTLTRVKSFHLREVKDG